MHMPEWVNSAAHTNNNHHTCRVGMQLRPAQLGGSADAALQASKHTLLPKTGEQRHDPLKKQN
jgi:hypothetical protein